MLIFLLLIWFDISAGKADKATPAEKTLMKKHGIRWDCGDYMMAGWVTTGWVTTTLRASPWSTFSTVRCFDCVTAAISISTTKMWNLAPYRNGTTYFTI